MGELVTSCCQLPVGTNGGAVDVARNDHTSLIADKYESLVLAE